jgi:uncharacterized protein
MKPGIGQAAALLCAAITLWGCAGGPAAPTRYYVLTPVQQPVALPSGTGDGPSVELGRVIMPEYLNQASILTRSSTNEVQRAEFDLWAGSLGDEITQTLGENLASELATGRLSIGGTRLSSSADFSVEVEIVTFDRDAANTVVLVARWSVFREDGKAPVAMHRSVYRQNAAGGGYADTVAAMSRALGDLSAEIAGTIKKSGSVARGGPSETRSGAR